MTSAKHPHLKRGCECQKNAEHPRMRISDPSLIIIIINFFISSKQEHSMLPRLVPNIKMLLADEAVSVLKRIVQAAAQLHKFTLIWISSAKVTTKEMILTWGVITDIKNEIIKMIDHDNDGYAITTSN